MMSVRKKSAARASSACPPRHARSCPARGRFCWRRERCGYHGHGRFAECRVHHDICGLAADAGSSSSASRVRALRRRAAQERPAGCDDVLRFAVVEADGFDVGGDAVDAQREHGCGCLRPGRERRCLVHAFVGGLRREHHRDQQFERRPNFSSVRGAGLCSRSRSKIARRFCGFTVAHQEGAAMRAAAEALSAASSRCRSCARLCRRPSGRRIVPDFVPADRRRAEVPAASRAIDRTGRQAQLAARASIRKHRVQEFRRPHDASTGQGDRQRAHPMQRSSSIHATLGSDSTPFAGFNGSNRRPSSAASARIVAAPPADID